MVVFDENPRFLVESTWHPVLFIVAFTLRTLHCAFNTFCCLRDDLYNSSNRFDKQACYTFTNSFAKADDSLFLGAFPWLGDNSSHTVEERHTKTFCSFADSINNILRLFFDVSNFLVVSVLLIEGEMKPSLIDRPGHLADNTAKSASSMR